MSRISFTRAQLPARKRIALVAHDHCKGFLLDWCERQRDELARHELVATGTTGLLLSKRLALPVESMISGPLGGDQQIGARIAEQRVDMLVFFWDPFEPQPHEPGYQGTAACSGGMEHPGGVQRKQRRLPAQQQPAGTAARVPYSRLPGLSGGSRIGCRLIP